MKLQAATSAYPNTTESRQAALATAFSSSPMAFTGTDALSEEAYTHAATTSSQAKPSFHTS